MPRVIHSAPLKNAPDLSEEKLGICPPKFGDIVCVEVVDEEGYFDYVEDWRGDKVPLKKGDRLFAVLGEKRSTVNVVGKVPTELKAGQELELLTFGGLVGICVSKAPHVKKLAKLRYLGSVLKAPKEAINLKDFARVRPSEKLKEVPPVVGVFGTSAESGKSTACRAIIEGLVERGLKVAGVKPIGVAALRDVLNMKKAGANPVYDFVDVGYPSTYVSKEEIARIAKGLLNAVRESDIVVAEFGGNVFGTLSVPAVLQDPEIRKAIKYVVLAASDVGAAYGGVRAFAEWYGMRVNVVTGPATDTVIGRKIAAARTGVKAINALTPDFSQVVEEIVEKVAS